jgi:VIT1/CCC1 family predicted Fe2+/Mn2+ transporter
MSMSWTEKLGLSSPNQASPPSSSESLPLYSAVASDDANPSDPAGHDPEAGASHDSLPSRLRAPLASYLADFTLGFADGLTVPFALTAGLSSLGRTDTVIYAGMAEICAGSISMGIGGYLAARGEKRQENEVVGGKGLDHAVANYLDPLQLPVQLRGIVEQHLRESPVIIDSLRQDDNKSSLMAGLSVALGYLVGGVLPLFPYLLVDQVKDGLLWSFVVCAVALFVFGFWKDFAMSGKPRTWRVIGRSAWEGTQMVILGSVAALAAVLCVRAFEGMSSHSEQS